MDVDRWQNRLCGGHGECRFGDVLRERAEQHGKRLPALRDGRSTFRGITLRLREIRILAIDLDLCGEVRVQACLRQCELRLTRADDVAEHLRARLRGAQFDVVAHDFGDERDARGGFVDGGAVEIGEVHASTRFGAAEKAELPGRIETHLDVAGLPARRRLFIDAEVEVRPEVAARSMVECARSAQAFARDLHVEILAQRTLDEPIEGRIGECAPPVFEVGLQPRARGWRGLLAAAPCRGRVFRQIGQRVLYLTRAQQQRAGKPASQRECWPRGVTARTSGGNAGQVASHEVFASLACIGPELARGSV